MSLTTLSGVFMTASWNLTDFLNNLSSSLEGWLGTAMVIVGLVMLGAGIYKGAKKLISQQGGQQISWITVIALIAIGAVLTVLGVSGLTDLGLGVTETIGDLGGSSGP